MSSELSAIVLAAGRSRRMGRIKSLLPLGDGTVLQKVLTGLDGAAPDRICLVLGPEGEAIAESVDGDDLILVWNRAEQSEMADSLRAALPFLPADGQGVVVCLGDQPLVAPSTYRRLAVEHRRHPESIIQPCLNDRRGHPVLLPQRLFQEISFRPTLRDVMAAHVSCLRTLEIADPGILLDMDTPDDYRDIQRRWNATRRD